MILHGHWKSRDQLDGSSLPPEKRNPKISGMGVKMGRNRGGESRGIREKKNGAGVQRNGVVLLVAVAAVVVAAVVVVVVVAFCH